MKILKENYQKQSFYVYDNNSTDGTDEIARKAGAEVRYERKQGKGNVIRTMFREIDAECYLMVDGDDTYPAEDARKMCNYVLNNNVDMVIGDRLSSTYFTENKMPSFLTSIFFFISAIQSFFGGLILHTMAKEKKQEFEIILNQYYDRFKDLLGGKNEEN